jgi:hypothetical protein
MRLWCYGAGVERRAKCTSHRCTSGVPLEGNIMHILPLSTAALLLAASASFAAPEQYRFHDHSSPELIDTDSAIAIWKAQVDENMRRRIQKLYPVSKWGFISQVQGGFTSDKVCVVTARAVMVPLILRSRLEFKPYKSATAFASQAGATREQCRDLAAERLKEAVLAIRSSLIAP